MEQLKTNKFTFEAVWKKLRYFNLDENNKIKFLIRTEHSAN